MPSIPRNELAGLLEAKINQLIQEQNLGGKKNLKASKKASAKLAKKVLRNAAKVQQKAAVNGSGKPGKGKKEQKAANEKKNATVQPAAEEPATQQ